MVIWLIKFCLETDSYLMDRLLNFSPFDRSKVPDMHRDFKFAEILGTKLVRGLRRSGALDFAVSMIDFTR